MRKDNIKVLLFYTFSFVSWNKTFEQKTLRVFKERKAFLEKKTQWPSSTKTSSFRRCSLIACQWPWNHYSMKAARAEETGSMDPPSRRGVAHRFICQHIVYQIKDKIQAQQ
ncbi:hypothetical protein CDAR_240341 [Caerostris darwini]|uniref:Uncharacterized protein n=1 Tax=Caerostris darwini TaxID=1538125 RepID=A0AAV4T0L0_9ARAC|nr:hypothetical protein CDAR_240341 [Caerostris darwini]